MRKFSTRIEIFYALFLNLGILEMGEQKSYTQVPYFTRIDGIIQDLPSNGSTMEMNHPLWPVVRETSRRILRNEEILISGPIQFQQLVINLGSKISDSIPERLKFPVFVESEKETIDIFRMLSNHAT